jgi:hypothetical protein
MQTSACQREAAVPPPRRVSTVLVMSDSGEAASAAIDREPRFGGPHQHRLAHRLAAAATSSHSPRRRRGRRFKSGAVSTNAAWSPM